MRLLLIVLIGGPVAGAWLGIAQSLLKTRLGAVAVAIFPAAAFVAALVMSSSDFRGWDEAETIKFSIATVMLGALLGSVLYEVLGDARS